MRIGFQKPAGFYKGLWVSFFLVLNGRILRFLQSFRTLQGDEFGPCVDDDDDDLGNEFALDEDRLVKQVASSSGSNQPQYGSAGLSGHGSSARDLREESVTPVPQSPQVRP